MILIKAADSDKKGAITFEQVFEDFEYEQAEEQHEELVTNKWAIVQWQHLFGVSLASYYKSTGSFPKK